MEGYVYIIIGAVLLVGIVLTLIFKKNFLSFTGPAKAILEAAKVVVNAYGQLDSSVVEVIQAAIDGTVKAEDLWKNGSLDKDKRNEYAQEYIKAILTNAKIDYSAYTGVIDCVITLICYLLPHNATSGEA